MTIEECLNRLKLYCEKEHFKGYDPFDGLNSKLFNSLPIKRNKYAKWFWIQLFKRLPFNIRNLVGIEKGYNSKGLGLFMYGYCLLYENENKQEYLERIELLADKLAQIKSAKYTHNCWGYNFDWQNRTFFQPAYTPTVVATSFIANAFFKAFEVTRNNQYLRTALGCVDFVCDDLNRTSKKRGIIFSYSPLDNSQVYNASLLGARLLSQGFKYTGKEKYKKLAREAVVAVVDAQREDGSWYYGENRNQKWVDSFHTGFNLECIYEYAQNTNDNSFEHALKLGMKYYLGNFFLPDGTPKYYNSKIYPIDIHSPAQLLVTLKRTERLNGNKELVNSVLKWTIKNMFSNKGFFYYQKNKYFTNKISYIRWSQAWMFYGLCHYDCYNK